jgi:hypothetical protein
MPYFMLSKIAFSGYKEGASSLVFCGPDSGPMSVREGPQVGLQLNGSHQSPSVSQWDGPLSSFGP